MICQQFFNIPVFVCELISSEYDRGFHAHEWGPKWPWKWGFERYSRGHDKVQGHPDPSRDGQSKHVAPGRHAHCLCRINFRLLCLGSPLLQVSKTFFGPFPLHRQTLPSQGQKHGGLAPTKREFTVVFESACYIPIVFFLFIHHIARKIRDLYPPHQSRPQLELASVSNSRAWLTFKSTACKKNPLPLCCHIALQ